MLGQEKKGRPNDFQSHLKVIMWKIHQKVVIWFSALLFNVLGIAWLYTFMATESKVHYGKFMVSAGGLALACALGLYLLWLPCVVLLFLLAVILLVFSVHLYLATQVLNPLVLGGGGLALVVIVNLAPPLLRRFLAKERGGADFDRQEE